MENKIPWITRQTLSDWIDSHHFHSSFFPAGSYEGFEALRPLLLQALEQRGIDGARADGFVVMAWAVAYQVLDSHKNPEYKKNVREVMRAVVDWLDLLISRIEGVSLMDTQPEEETTILLEEVPESVHSSTPHSTPPSPPLSNGHEPKFCARESRWKCSRCGVDSGSWNWPCVSGVSQEEALTEAPPCEAEGGSVGITFPKGRI